MRVVEIGLGEAGRVGADQRQVARIGEVDQLGLGAGLHLVVAAGDLDIEPVGEQRLELRDIGLGGLVLPLGIEPGECTLGTCGQAEQAVGMPGERREGDVRIFLDRPVEVRLRDEVAEIFIAGLVLRVERQPVDRHVEAFGQIRALHRKQCADDRLDAGLLGGVRKAHRGIEAVAIRDGDGGEAVALGVLGDRLGVDRPFEHGVAGKNPKRDETGMRHART